MLPESFFLLLMAALTVWAHGQSELFESASFNAKEALLNQGFDEAVIPVAPDFAARSAGWACTAAVRKLLTLPMYPILHLRSHSILLPELGHKLIDQRHSVTSCGWRLATIASLPAKNHSMGTSLVATGQRCKEMSAHSAFSSLLTQWRFPVWSIFPG
jgi:hypothetical protein